MTLTIKGSVFVDNHANEGGGAIFFVSDDRTGTMAISHQHRSSAIATTDSDRGLLESSSSAPGPDNPRSRSCAELEAPAACATALAKRPPARSVQGDQVDQEHQRLVGADDPAGAALCRSPASAGS